MVMSRRRIVYAGDEIVSDELIDETWERVRTVRDVQLEATDRLMALSDRWTDEQMTALLTYRQALRDLPQTYESANEAADNFPEAEEWF